MKKKTPALPEYMKIVNHYESCLDTYGDTHRGVDWPNREDAHTRYRVMLDLIREKDEDVSLLDFGCGASHLYEYIQRNNIQGITYSGLDLSKKFVALSKAKFPRNRYYVADVLDRGSKLPHFDYIVMNGVFTEKRELSFEKMFKYFTTMIKTIYPHADRGIAFNVMSKHVDWEREDLFHVPFDRLAAFLRKEISRHFIIRNDYGLYEFTTYVYR